MTTFLLKNRQKESKYENRTSRNTMWEKLANYFKREPNICRE